MKDAPTAPCCANHQPFDLTLALPGAPLGRVQKLLFSLFTLALIGCASSATTPARTPDAANEAAPSRTEPATTAKNEKAVPPPLKVPDPPALCDEFTQRQTAQCGAGAPPPTSRR